MPLLWKSHKRPGPSDRPYAVNRLISFERKLIQDPGLRKKANDTIKRYEERNYITRANARTPETAWYLPIFAISNPSKTRLVWDAAAQCNGILLNSLLLKGPDLNEPLWNILHRFREYPVAFCADVSEMFYQIQVPREDR